MYKYRGFQISPLHWQIGCFPMKKFVSYVHSCEIASGGSATCKATLYSLYISCWNTIQLYLGIFSRTAWLESHVATHFWDTSHHDDSNDTKNTPIVKKFSLRFQVKGFLCFRQKFCFYEDVTENVYSIKFRPTSMNNKFHTFSQV